ncbi:MAG: LysR family transcriptional regulator [Eggerthellaceae bacterium]|nr:LysR family transcriptional regulator [Eggerthellaceae bacterium]
MDLQQMTYFLEVARTEHVTNSARRLHIAQPALTQSIHRLEHELGVELFERSGRGIKLTPAGAYLRDRIAPAVESLRTATGDVRAFAEQSERTVSVGIYAASTLAVDAIAAYKEHHPDVTFRISQAEGAQRPDVVVTTLEAPLPPDTPSTNAFEQQLAARIRAVMPEDPDTSLRRERRGMHPSNDEAIGAANTQTEGKRALFSERIGVAVPQESRYGKTAQLQELAGEDFICLAGSRRFRAICDTLCAQRLFFPRITFESDSPAIVKKVIGAGLGVGFWPTRSWESLDGGNARLVLLEEQEFARTISIGCAPHVKEESDAARFYAFLAKRVEETLC